MKTISNILTEWAKDFEVADQKTGYNTEEIQETLYMLAMSARSQHVHIVHEVFVFARRLAKNNLQSPNPAIRQEAHAVIKWLDSLKKLAPSTVI